MRPRGLAAPAGAEAFAARIGIIGVNPFVVPPARVLGAICAAAGRDKGPIPVRGTVQGKPFRQTLVRYQGRWRLYLNGPMRRSAGVEVGATARFTVAFDPAPPVVPMPRELARALAQAPRAKAAFQLLAPSRRKEIKRYLNSLKSAATLERNVGRVLLHLVGAGPKELRPLMRK